MKRLNLIVVIFISLTILSCSHQVTRIEPTATPDINGSWNNTDSSCSLTGGTY